MISNIKLYRKEVFSKEQKTFNELHMNVTFHGLRYSFAIASIRNNVEIKALSETPGHSNISVTLLFIHTSLEQKKRELAKLVTPDIIID